MRKRRIRKALLWLGMLVFSWPVITGAIIWKFGHTDYSRQSDSIIVLGAAAYHKNPSPVFKERISHAITLFNDEKAPKIIFTGGFGDGAEYAESEVGATYAVKSGVSKKAILTETQSRTTKQNLMEAKALMDANSLKTAIIVSDPLHLKRAAALAEEIGINAVTSPTPTSRYRSLSKKFEFLRLEIYSYNRYLLERIIGD